MKRLIYMAITLASALSIGGCSSAITTKDLTIIDEIENQKQIEITPSVTDEGTERSLPTIAPESRKDTATVITKASDRSELIFDLEGNREVVSVRDYNSTLGYQIKIDEERFTHSDVDGTDVYTAKNPDPSKYPDIYIKISRREKSNESNYLDELKQQLLSENPQLEVLSDSKVSTYDAIVFHSVMGTDYNSPIKKIAVIESDNEYHTIETQYFLEAEEGYGARIMALLDTLILTI